MAPKKAASGNDDAFSFDLSKLSKKDREKMLALLKKDEKKREKDSKKVKRDIVKAAEDKAEQDYQKTAKKSSQATSGKPTSTATPTSIVPAKRGKKSKAPPATNPEDSEEAGSGQDEETRSADGYESGHDPDIPIDPELLKQAHATTVTSDEEQQPAKKKAKAASGKSVKTAPTPKTSAKGLVNVNVASPQALFQTPGRGAAKIAKQAAVELLSSSDSGSSDSSDSSDSDTRTRAAPGPHTPYKAPVLGRGKSAPGLRDLSPTTRSLAEDLRTKYSVFLATVDAFPTERDARKTARKLFIAEVDSVVHQDELDEDEDADKRQRRGERAKADKTYSEHVKNMVTNVDSSFRGHVVDDAAPLVENEYGLLDPELDEKAIADRVGLLLENGSFTFKVWKERNGAFQCPIVPKLLRKAFLTKQVKKGHALGLGPNFQVFSEVTPPLLAFLLTAIECVLTRWQTGKHEKSHFTMAKYEPIYTKHLKALHETEVTTPGSLSDIRKNIWVLACKSAGIQPPTKVRDLDHSGGYMRAEDFAKMRGQQSPPA